MRAFASLGAVLAAIVSAASLIMACVGDSPAIDPAGASSSSGDGGASSSSSSSSSSGGNADGGTTSSSGSGSSSGQLVEGGTYSVGASRIHWHLLNGQGQSITCQTAGGQTMQIEATPLNAGNNNLKNSLCEEDATEGVVTVGNLPLDLAYTTDVLLYLHLDPLDDETPLAVSPIQDLSFANGCNVIENDTCVRTFELNIVVNP